MRCPVDLPAMHHRKCMCMLAEHPVVLRKEKVLHKQCTGHNEDTKVVAVSHILECL